MRKTSINEISFHGRSRWKIYVDICGTERRNFAIALSLLTIKHSPALFLPVVTANVINAIIDGGDNAMQAFVVNTLIITALFLQNIVTHTYFISFLSKANRSIEQSLRKALVVRMQELSISFHNGFESGRLQSKVLRDVESIEVLSRQLVINVFTALITIIFAMVATLMHDWFVALFYLVSIPLSVVLMRIFQKRMADTNQDYRVEVEEMSARVNEMVEMIPTTRAHGLEHIEIRHIGKQLKKVKEKAIKLDIFNAVFGASTWVTYQFFQFACLLVTAFMAYKGTIGVGDVVMYQGFFAMIVWSVNGIINVMPELNRGFDSIQSLGDILQCPDIESNKGKQKIEIVKGAISFKDVCFSYTQDKPTIARLTLDVKPGECVAIVGESGAGKSTLMNLLVGYIRPTGGCIVLDGCDMQEVDMRSYRKSLSVVPQNIVLFSGTIKENILYGIEQGAVADDTFEQVVKASRVDEFVRELPDGYDTRIGEHGSRLSGGQRQRIAIARALIRDPRVIIFDEATSALDVRSEQHVQQAIADLTSNRTTFIIAHRLSTVKRADRIVVLHKGEIVEVGRHDDLMKQEESYYRKMHFM